MICTWFRFALIVTFIAGACSDRKPQPPKRPVAKPTAGKPTAPPVATAPIKPKPSLLALAREQIDLPLRSPKSIGAAIEAANRLEKWAKAHPDQAATARYLAARFRFFATAASAGLRTGPAARALGGDGAQGRELKRANRLLVGLKKAGAKFPELERTSLAVRAARGIDPDVKDVPFDRRRALALALGDTQEGLALRAVWLDRLEIALQTLRSPDPDYRFFRFARKAGRMLCSGCSDAHHVTPNMVTSSLLMARNKGGFICDGAYAAGAQGKGHLAQIAALSRCSESLGLAVGIEPVAYWGSNLMALSLLRVAGQLSSAAIGDGPTAAAVKKRAAVVATLVKAPLVLPTPLITTVLPETGPRSSADKPAVIAGLGFAGQISRRHRLELFIVGPKNMRAGLRPVMTLKDGQVLSLTARSDYPAGGVQVMSVDALLSAPRKADGSVQAVVTVAGRIRTTLKEFQTVKPAAVPDMKEGALADLVLDAMLPAPAAVRVLDSLYAAGYRYFRFLKTETAGQSLPLIVRQAPKRLAAELPPAFERPMIAVVTRKYVDIWRPSKLTGKPWPKDKKVKAPDGVNPGYKGRTFVRYRIRIPDALGHGIDATTLHTVQGAAHAMRAHTGAAPILHVVAGKGALASDVLRVARIFQETRGERLKNPTTIWPDTQCGGEGNVVNRRRPKGCPTGVAIAFSKIGPPSSGGVSSRMSKREKKAKTVAPAPPPKPKAAAGFCAKGQIRTAMRRRSAFFKFCYERELRLNKTLKGRVVVRFTIGANGKLVGSPRIASSSLKHGGVHRCLIKHIRRVRFSKPSGGTCSVRYPFKFRPR